MEGIRSRNGPSQGLALVRTGTSPCPQVTQTGRAMNSGIDLIALARQVDGYADEADARGNDQRAVELRQLARALRAKGSANSRRLHQRTRRAS